MDILYYSKIVTNVYRNSVYIHPLAELSIKTVGDEIKNKL